MESEDHSEKDYNTNDSTWTRELDFEKVRIRLPRNLESCSPQSSHPVNDSNLCRNRTMFDLDLGDTPNFYGKPTLLF